MRSEYLGTDIDAFVQNADVMYNLEYTSAIGYQNDYLLVTAYDTISEIEINSKCDYTLCDVYVGMDYAEAIDLIYAAGGTDTGESSDGGRKFSFGDAQTITIWDSGGKIEKVTMQNQEW